jgi:hypothetical protein
MNAEALASRLNAVRSGRQWKCRCVAHEDREPSMIIFDGVTAVQVRCLAGCAPGDIIGELERRGLWEGEPQTGWEKLTRQKVGAADRHRELAQAIFDDAVPILHTMAERYFEGRDLLDVALRVSDIRFHPYCPRGDERRPAIVVAMRSFASAAVHAVQRIYLTKHFGAVFKDGAMMLGSPSGCAMMLQARGSELHIAEGLESGLAVWAMDHAPVYALGSSSLLSAMPVLDGVERLVIWADHDEINPKTGKRAGGAAALVCGERWAAQCRHVEIMTPKVERFDAADVWSERLARR